MSSVLFWGDLVIEDQFKDNLMIVSLCGERGSADFMPIPVNTRIAIYYLSKGHL
ncbi:hypothetical protein D3C85_1095950 [compost metagenome]